MPNSSTMETCDDSQTRAPPATDQSPRQEDSADAAQPNTADSATTNDKVTKLRRDVRSGLVSTTLKLDDLFRLLITNEQLALPLSAPTSDEASQAQPRNQQTLEQGSESPDVFRTVIAQRGNTLNREKTYLAMSEVDYDGVETHNKGAAFEMRKEVATIKPPSQDIAWVRHGNPALNNDIVDHVISEKIVIRSPQLLKVIKDNIYWPSSAFYDGQRSLSLNSPYRSIGVYRDDLGDALARMKDDLASAEASANHGDLSPKEMDVRHLELFLREVDKVQSHSIKLENERHSRGMATFDMLWKLFRPGTLVYTEIDGVKLACRVKLSVWSHGSLTKAGPNDPFQKIGVILWYLDHDGRLINRRARHVSISRYHGEKRILDLPVYPEKFLPGWEALKKTRVERGRRFVRLIKNGYSYCNYEGEISRDAKNPYIPQHHQTYVGKVMVDPEQHFLESGLSQGSEWLDEYDVQENATGVELRSYLKLDPTVKVNDNSTEAIPSGFGDDQLVLLPEWIRGFTMSTHGERRWVWLHVDSIQDYEPDRDLVQTIALNADDMRLLKAMMYISPRSDNLWSPERIEHKGTGRVILLHGAPGLGKTYTVECMAAWSGRPLLRLTCAELGVDPRELERSLSMYLTRAERWKAIVLIDEADVYMTERLQHSDSKSTGIVSVFLRALEYYSGIIFLTTNRIKVVDYAIISRALLILEYKQLDEAQIEKILQNCLKSQSEKSSIEIDGEARRVLRTALTEEGGHQYNGREILQVFTIATRLASFESESSTMPPKVTTIGKEHVVDALRIVRKHDLYRDALRNLVA